MALIDRMLCLLFGSRRARKGVALIAALAGFIFIAEGWHPADSRGEPARLNSSEERKLMAENARLRASIAAQAPKGVYIAVDTARNRLFLNKGKTQILEAVCSTGNGKILRDPAGKNEWMFATPTGERRILKKVERPVWTKPDWAFIEEGDAPPVSFKERIEEDILGDYAMHLGNSYLIHGTLYRRLLGRSVTHGCVRLGDADLQTVFKASPVGTPVYIY